MTPLSRNAYGFREPTPLWKQVMFRRMSMRMMKPLRDIRKKVHALPTQYSGKAHSLEEWQSRLYSRRPFRVLWRLHRRWRNDTTRVLAEPTERLPNRRWRWVRSWQSFKQAGGVEVVHRML